MVTPDMPYLDMESASALADKAIEETFVPKKIPPFEDIDGQTTAVVGAFASALLTATDFPITTLQSVMTDVAKQMVAFGIRQTEHVDPTAQRAPAWITDGVRQEAMPVPPQPQHTEAEPAEARTAEAPTMPKRIPSTARATRL